MKSELDSEGIVQVPKRGAVEVPEPEKKMEKKLQHTQAFEQVGMCFFAFLLVDVVVSPSSYGKHAKQ